jgi:hypothetical protein
VKQLGLEHAGLTSFAPLPTGLACCPQRGAAGACFSDDRADRFALWRRWDERPMLGYALLNPSIADETVLDPTLKRCRAIATHAGYGGMEVVNLFSLVSTDPTGLRSRDHEPAAATNLAHLRDLAARATLVIGFGDLKTYAASMQPTMQARVRALAEALKGLPLFALGTTANGFPKHPLARGKAFVPRDTRPAPYDLRATLDAMGA